MTSSRSGIPSVAAATAGDYVWLSVVRHLHYRDHRPEAEKRAASVCDLAQRHASVDYFVIEEHGQLSPDAVRSQVCGPALPVAIPGVESYAGMHLWGKPSDHHVGVVNVSSEQQARVAFVEGESAAVMRAKVERAGGAFILNHPEWPYVDHKPTVESALGYELQVEDARQFHGVELYNDTLTPEGNEPGPVLAWIERNFYARGLAPAIVSGADEHGQERAARVTHTVAMTAQRTPAGLVDAIRGARTYVTTDRRMRLDDLQIDGRSGLGARPRWLRASGHQLTLKIQGMPRAGRLEVVHNGQVLHTTQGSSAPSRVSVTVPAQPLPNAEHGYLYVRAFDDRGKMILVTSAIVYEIAEAATPTTGDEGR